MFHQKNILPLIYKAWSFILVLFFLLPSGLKVIHAYSFHSTQKECKHNTTHLHSSTLHNDVLDYYFHFLAETNLAPIELFVPIIFHEKVDRNHASFYNLDIYFTTPRGPPVC